MEKAGEDEPLIEIVDVEKQEEIRSKGKRYPQKNGGNSVLAPAQLEQEEYIDEERVYKKRD